MITFTHNLPLSSLIQKLVHFLLSRINKLDCNFLYWKNLSIVCPLRNHVTSLLSHQSLSACKDGGQRQHGLLWCCSCTLREEPWNQRRPNFWTSQSCFLWSNWFFECEHLIYFLINRWLQLNLLYILSTGPLGLGSKVYPSNMQRMLNKGFTRFKQRLSRARQDRASKRKSLLAGWCLRW